MKNLLKVFVLVLVVFCMVVSCSKNTGSSGSGGGSSNDTDGSGTAAGSSGSSGGGGSAAAVSSDNFFKNVMGSIDNGKNEIIPNNWAGIPWADFGLSAAPSEPSGGKLEAAFITPADKSPYIFISNVSRAAYEKLCREIEAGYSKEGDINSNAFDFYLLANLKLKKWDECYEIDLGSKLVKGSALRQGEWDDEAHRQEINEFRIYYYDSPVNGVVMTLFSEIIL